MHENYNPVYENGIFRLFVDKMTYQPTVAMNLDTWFVVFD
jgi:hypothetical protein